ncbi:hypothetical protein GC167_05465 [bacterium]|nr:hypothetical protein [bacterium]
MKKVFFPLFSIFLLYQAVKMLLFLWGTPPETLPMGIQLLLSFLLSLYLTGVFAFVGFAFPTSRALKGYYRIRNPRLLELIYRRMGVEAFRQALLRTYWGKPQHQKRFFDGRQGGIEALMHQTRQAEFGHLGAGVCIGLATVLLGWKGHWGIVLGLIFWNVVGNGYPIVLQRHHRMRIERIIRTHTSSLGQIPRQNIV